MLKEGNVYITLRSKHFAQIGQETEMIEKNYKNCVLCKKLYTGWGNNPEPLEHPAYKCCDVCNETKVIPARIAEVYARRMNA